MSRSVLSAALPLAAVLSLAAPRPVLAQQKPEPPPPIWDAQVGASFVGTGGNTETSSLGTDVVVHRRWPEWKVESTASAVRTTDADERTAERYIGTVRADRRITELVSASFGERGERDRLAGIRLRSLLDAGLSWGVVRRARWTVDAVTGVAWKHERALDAHPVNHVTGLLQGLSRVPLGTLGETTQRLTIYPDFNESSDYRSEAEVTVQAALNSRLALKLGYLWRYSNRPVAAFAKSDTMATASVVLRWRGAPVAR